MLLNKKTTHILLLSAALTWSTAVPAFADDGSTPSASVLSMGSAPSLGEVKVTDSSYFELKNVTILPEKGSKTVTFTVSVHNEGSSDLLFIDYWPRLKTKSGNQISVRVLPQDKDKNRITPKSVQDISFYATVNDTTNLTDLIFEFIKWDFSQPNFERSIGEIAVPDDYTVVTPKDDSHIIDMDGTEIKTTIKKVLLTKNDKNYTPTVVLKMENVGNRSAAVPSYQYLIRTSEGYMYPLDAKNVKDLTINPQVDKEVQLTGSVPIEVSREGWQLVITQNAADLKLNLPIAYFELPQVTDPDTVDTGKEYEFSNKEGTYTSKLLSFQRLPMEDQDILSANLMLLNKGSDSLPLPDLTGYFMLDDKVKVEAKLIQTDKVIGLPSGGSANYQFIGKMPYTYQFSTVKLVLQEKKGENEAEDLLEFLHRSELLNMTFLNVGETYKNMNIGRNTSYAVRDVKTYSGDTADIFTVQLEATNLEKRYTDVTKLVAQFKTFDGDVYPAAVSEIKNKITPGGKALLILSSTLPKGFPTSNMSAMIGEAVTDNKFSASADTPDAYVNAAGFWLPQENYQVKDKLADIDLLPYTLSISKINTWLDSEKLKLTFNYELTKNLLMETNTEGRKLVIGLEDESGNKTFMKEFDFKDFDIVDSTTSDASKDTKIRLGKRDGFVIEEQDRDLIYHLETLKTYKLSVYDSYQGQKKLLASQKIDWFSTTD
ncbi:hypothetical protein SK3146_06416 [Paenibacillus konkukensis]|uniref:Uncharacterized protein n=1 Tax=Paenibacillus konkukensis TaxID=2020716 RepID=A0ABY4RY19_9BACL|nr:hypothetical protein [Paenibacillus konkukensis]UQZ87123.1 hypothetical protein SK3146_06416 [Paenibacillus konkukensis]